MSLREDIARLTKNYEASVAHTAPLLESNAELFSAMEQPLSSALAQVLAGCYVPQPLRALGLEDAIEATPEGSSFSDWLGGHLGLSMWRESKHQAILRRMALIADALCRPPYNLPVFLPICFRVDLASEKITTSWLHLSSMCLEAGQASWKPHQRALRYELSPQWGRGLPRDWEQSIQQEMRTSFARFLLGTLHPQAEFLRQERRFDALRSLLPSLPPSIPALFHEIFFVEPPSSADLSCTTLWREILDSLDAQANLSHTALTRRDLRTQRARYLVTGRFKEGAMQDAELPYCEFPQGIVVGGIADGVSCADLGSGDEAAQEVARCFRIVAHRHFASAPLPDDIPKAFQAFWQEFVETANEAIVARCNELQSPHLPPAEDPMSSTFTAFALIGDYAEIAWGGDSPAWLFQAQTQRLIRLTYNQDEATQRLQDGEEAPFQTTRNDQALSCYLGFSSWESQHKRYQAITPPYERISVRLAPHDLLLLASDGLLSHLQEQDAFSQDDWLTQALRDAQQDAPSLHHTAYQLIQIPEEEGSDHIALLLVSIELAPQAPSQPPKQEQSKSPQEQSEENVPPPHTQAPATLTQQPATPTQHPFSHPTKDASNDAKAPSMPEVATKPSKRKHRYRSE